MRFIGNAQVAGEANRGVFGIHVGHGRGLHAPGGEFFFFEPEAMDYSQVHASPSPTTGKLVRMNAGASGQPLGLAITKAIAESHGGKLCLENTSAGLTAAINLPAT